MRSKKILIWAVAAVVATAFSACKPTEKNYREAYEAAINKRQQSDADPDEVGLIREGSPRVQVIEGDSLYFLYETIRPDEGAVLNGPLSVSVGKFKMMTNARSGAKALREQGFDAFAARAAAERWYVIAGNCESVKEAKELMARFRKKNPSYPYIGQEGHPVIIRN